MFKSGPSLHQISLENLNILPSNSVGEEYKAAKIKNKYVLNNFDICNSFLASSYIHVLAKEYQLTIAIFEIIPNEQQAAVTALLHYCAPAMQQIITHDEMRSQPLNTGVYAPDVTACAGGDSRS